MPARLKFRTEAVVSGVAASLLLAGPASAAGEPVVVYAEPQENVRTERVSFADLDLARRSDQRLLNMRVAGAIKRVCLFEDRIGFQDSGYYRCADGARDGAQPQIAQAVARAQQIALTGSSTIAATAITISVPQL